MKSLFAKTDNSIFNNSQKSCLFILQLISIKLQLGYVD